MGNFVNQLFTLSQIHSIEMDSVQSIEASRLIRLKKLLLLLRNRI